MNLKIKEEELEILSKYVKDEQTEKVSRISFEEQAKRDRENKRHTILSFYKMFTGEDMTEEEFQEYCEIFENEKTRKGFNIYSYIRGDRGQPDLEIEEEVEKELEESDENPVTQ